MKPLAFILVGLVAGMMMHAPLSRRVEAPPEPKIISLKDFSPGTLVFRVHADASTYTDGADALFLRLCQQPPELVEWTASAPSGWEVVLTDNTSPDTISTVPLYREP